MPKFNYTNLDKILTEKLYGGDTLIYEEGYRLLGYKIYSHIWLNVWITRVLIKTIILVAQSSSTRKHITCIKKLMSPTF